MSGTPWKHATQSWMIPFESNVHVMVWIYHKKDRIDNLRERHTHRKERESEESLFDSKNNKEETDLKISWKNGIFETNQSKLINNSSKYKWTKLPI